LSDESEREHRGGKGNFPSHIAIIMDGNGRWAARRGLSRFQGHERGAETAEKIVTFCAERRIRYVTLYTFSVDNWKRPAAEVSFLMGLLKRFLKTKTGVFVENEIAFRAVGRLEMLPADVRKEIAALEKKTAGFDRMLLCLALSYGAREEIVDAAKKACAAAAAGEIDPAGLTPERFAAFLQTAEVPDPDMLVRTGGEKRLSNFLLWQLSYTELFFTDTMWPDFTVEELEAMIDEFGRRERRFGGL